MSTWKAPKKTHSSGPRPALFLDRDGVVIADAHYLSDPEKVQILPGVSKAMALARREGFLLVGVSNQSGIGRGYFSLQEFESVMDALDGKLFLQEAQFDSFHYCPHTPDEDCACRKPRLGMFDEAQALHGVDLSRSWMIGDKCSDVVFGRAAGMAGVLVRTGYGTKEEDKLKRLYPDDSRVWVADDLPSAIGRILAKPPLETS